MNRFFEGITNGIRSAAAAWFPSLYNGLTTLGPSGRLNVPGINRPAENIVTIFAAMEAWQNAIAKVPMVISTGDNDVIEGGDLAQLMARPTADMDRHQWLRTITSHYVLTRMFCLAKVSSTPGAAPDELVPLNPIFIFPLIAIHQPTGVARALKWNYVDPWTGSYRTFDPEELIIVMNPNPHTPLRPLSPTLAAMRSMQADIAIHESNLAIFLRGGVPSMVFETDMELRADQVKERMQRIIDRNTGYDKHYAPLLLDKNLKMSKASWSPVELQMLEGLRYTREELMMATGCYPVMLKILTGETGFTQGNSADEQWQLWWENEGLSFLDLLSSALTAGVAAKHSWSTRTRKMTTVEIRAMRASFDRVPAIARSALKIGFNENAIPSLHRQRLTRFTQMANLITWGYAPDDARDALGLILPDHPTNIATVPMSVIPAESLGEEPETETQMSEIGGQKEEDTEPERKMRAAFESIGRALGESEISNPESQIRRSAAHAAHARKFHAAVESQTRVSSRKIARYFAAQKVRVIARLNRTKRGQTTEDRGQTRSEASDLLKEIFVTKEENRELVKQLMGSWTSALRSGWDLTNEAIGQTEKTNPFEVADPRVADAIAAREKQAAAMNDTTAGDLLGILRDGIEDGQTNTEIGDAIADYYAGIGTGTGRPDTAARTMMSGTINDGQMAAANAVGGLLKIWIHGAPTEAREAHVSAEDHYSAGIPLDEDFVINGEHMNAPGDASADISETANCTCCVGYKKA